MANTPKTIPDVVQAIKDYTDNKLSDYHVTPSINHLPFHTGAVGSYQFVADTNGYMSCTADDGRGWGYANANEYITLPAGTYKYKAFQKTASTDWHTGFQIFKNDDTAIVNVSLANAITGGTFTLSAETGIGVEYKLGNGAYAFQIVDDTEDNTTYHVWYVCMRDGKLDIADEQVLGAWNLQPNRVNAQTIGEITFTPHADGSISYSSNGSAVSTGRELVITVRSGKIGYLNFLKNDTYYLSGGLSSRVKLIAFSTQNNAYSAYGEDTGNGLRFTVNGESSSPDGAYVGLNLFIGAGEAISGTVKPMIALKPNMPYVPYVPTNRDCMSYAVNGELGAHNFFKVTIPTTTASGITFTVNDNGIITTGNQQATGNVRLPIGSAVLNKGRYRLSGAPNGTFYFNITTTGYNSINETGSGVEFDVSADNTTITVQIAENGTNTANYLTFKPMITLASDTDPTYQPYAMTNRELTAGFIKCSKYDFSYTASMVSKNTQMVQVTVNEPKTRIIAMWVDCASTNDRGSCNYVDTNKIAYVLITNEMGHSTALPFNAHLYVLYI